MAWVVLLLIALAWDVAAAWWRPWKACACAGRGCMSCKWHGKRPKALARIVRRRLMKREGWL